MEDAFNVHHTLNLVQVTRSGTNTVQQQSLIDSFNYIIIYIISCAYYSFLLT
jgi:hypothetical protein